jgi:outer membrane protein
MKKQLHQGQLWRFVMLYRVAIVLIVFVCLAGCAGSSRDGTRRSEILMEDLAAIDTVQLADQSVAPPVTVEEATEQITQQVAEPNAPVETLELTLEQVRQAALANNLDLKVELIDPAIARRSLDAERAKFEAVFFGSADYYHADNSDATTKIQGYELGISKPLATGGTLEVGLPFGDDASSGGVADAAASVTYIQSLLRGGGTRINRQSIRIAEHQWNIVSARTKLAAISLLANADITYWRLYAARKELDVRQEQYKLAQNQLSHAEKKVAAGSAAKTEIVRARAGLSSRLEALINAETAVQSYRRDLLRIMNQDDLPFEAAIDIVPKTEPNPLGLDLDEKQLAEKALDLRMEMVQLGQYLIVDDLNIELARDATRPDLALSYRYTTQAEARSVGGAFGDLAGDSSDNHVIGLSATIPLGNRAARAHLQRAHLTKIQDQAQRDRLRQAIRQSVYEAVSELERNWRRILAAEQGVVAAYRDYRVEQSQFQLGVRTSTDVLLSARGLADAQLSQIRAFADYEIAQVNLARATGTLLGYGQVFLQPVDLEGQANASALD